tara:strand:+ start:90722 stop:91189 length:468 start_codon:yes stop_codon:yes gene_type:complete
MLKIFTGSGKNSDTACRTVALCVPVWLSRAILLWICAPTFALATSVEEYVTLSAQPRICVMTPGEQVCSMQMLVSWTAVSDISVCLKFPEQAEALHCWQAQQQGEFSVSVSREENVSVQLLDAQTNQILSEVEIPVIKRDLRDTRRRRRHAWSIF